MTRQWTDGFEINDYIGYCLGNLGTALSNTLYRSGAISAGLTASGPTSDAWFSFPVAGVSEFYLRFGVHVPTGPGLGNDWPFVYWSGGGANQGYIHFASCNLITIHNSIGTILDTGTTPLFRDTWYLIEVHVKISATVGIIEVKLDGASVLECSFSGNTGTGTVDTIRFAVGYGGLGTINIANFDDLAFNDTAGGVDDSWCGEGKIIVMLPNDDSAPLELTPSAAVDHHTLVDDIPTDGDTTYVEGSVIDEEDMYKLTPSGLVDVDINRVYVESRSRKTAASDGHVALITKAAGGAEVSGGDVELLTTYSIKCLSAEELVNPVDSAAWEVADIDLIEIGPRTR